MNTQFTLPDETSIRYERTFSAPAERVWQAYTDPEIFRQWMLGPDPETTTFEVCEMDIRPGGSYRYVWENPDGRLEIIGEVSEAEPPHRIVSSERMGGTDVPPTACVVTFEERDGQTIMTGMVTFQRAEQRDGAYASGMAEGMEFGFNKLAELV